MKYYAFYFFVLFSFRTLLAQCPSGAIGVTGSGCGCLSGCNLSSLGGPNCSPSIGGNCDAGYTDMVPTDIDVPAGCTFTVTATMSNRAGCSASGADGNCQTCDVLKVDVFPGGSKSYQQGGSNATLTDDYTLVGPGTIRVSGRANRADEIVTYAVTATNCVNCISVLPIELMEFTAVAKKNTVALSWATASERNNDYFTIERSTEGKQFEPYAYMAGAGNSSSVLRYSLTDSSPLEGISYYRLKQTDFDGSTTYSKIQSVHFVEELEIAIYPNPSNGECFLTGKKVQDCTISLIDAYGKEVTVPRSNDGTGVKFITHALVNGIYFIRITRNEEVQQLKLLIQH